MYQYLAFISIELIWILFLNNKKYGCHNKDRSSSHINSAILTIFQLLSGVNLNWLTLSSVCLCLMQAEEIN